MFSQQERWLLVGSSSSLFLVSTLRILQTSSGLSQYQESPNMRNEHWEASSPFNFICIHKERRWHCRVFSIFLPQLWASSRPANRNTQCHCLSDLFMPRNMVGGSELKGFSPKVCWCCILGCQKSTCPTRNIGEPITIIVLIKSNLPKFCLSYCILKQERLMLSSLSSISLSSFKHFPGQV